jgi:hypothetical protein
MNATVRWWFYKELSTRHLGVSLAPITWVIWVCETPESDALQIQVLETNWTRVYFSKKKHLKLAKGKIQIFQWGLSPGFETT